MFKKIAGALALAFSMMLFAGMLFGCASGGSGEAVTGQGDTQAASEEGAVVEDLTPDSPLFQLMDQLTTKTTLEEANEIIGFEGEETSKTDSSTLYTWDIDDDCSIEGTFFSSGGARFDAGYPAKLVAERADFGAWDEIEARMDAGTITYDEFVELLGGVPGLKDTIQGGEYTYHWYDEDGGYLFAQVDNETGEVDIASGRF